MSHRTLASRLAAAATAALLLAGCTAAGGGDGSSVSPSPSSSASPSVLAQPDPNHPDPCEVFTAEDFEAWGGTPAMTEGRFIGSLSGDGRSICRWEPASDELAVPLIQVILNWEYADITEQRQLAEDIGASPEDITIEGADAAYSVYGGRTIAMTVGEYFVQVSYTRPASKAADVKTACAHFATLAASRL